MTPQQERAINRALSRGRIVRFSREQLPPVVRQDFDRNHPKGPAIVCHVETRTGSMYFRPGTNWVMEQ